MPTGSNRGRPSTMQQLGPYMGMGFQLAITMCVFGGLGWWLDGRLGTTPWLLVAGCMIGAVGGMISMIRTSLNKKSSDEQGKS